MLARSRWRFVRRRDADVLCFDALVSLLCQAEAAKAAQDMAAILSAAKNKKKTALHPNEMAALALTFNPVRDYPNLRHFGREGADPMAR